jgi:hypothetical protein
MHIYSHNGRIYLYQLYFLVLRMHLNKFVIGTIVAVYLFIIKIIDLPIVKCMNMCNVTVFSLTFWLFLSIIIG